MRDVGFITENTYTEKVSLLHAYWLSCGGTWKLHMPVPSVNLLLFAFPLAQLLSCEVAAESHMCLNQFSGATTTQQMWKQYFLCKSKAVPLHAMKTHGGEEVLLLLILNLGTRWGWVFSIMPQQCFTPRERAPWYPMHRRLGGPRAGLDAETRRKILCLCQGLNPGCPVHSQSLYWLSYPSSYTFSVVSPTLTTSVKEWRYLNTKSNNDSAYEISMEDTETCEVEATLVPVKRGVIWCTVIDLWNICNICQCNLCTVASINIMAALLKNVYTFTTVSYIFEDPVVSALESNRCYQQHLPSIMVRTVYWTHITTAKHNVKLQI
jgi:hypothetical protein